MEKLLSLNGRNAKETTTSILEIGMLVLHIASTEKIFPKKPSSRLSFMQIKICAILT